MSILIKGMKMPKNCGECPLNREEYWNGDTYMYFCHPRKAGLYLRDLDTRHADCPLIELPPHGRLIDGDVAEVITYTDEDGTFADGILYAADWIAQQPTIIEAEEVSE